MRGIVMVVMALDHTRDFFHQGAFVYNATDMATTTPVLFFTRFITHFCAPTFVLLAGTSIYISAQRKTKKDLSVFLLTRGLWLILLEVIVIRFSFFFNFYYDVTIMQVIWVIGASMICMSLFIHLADRAVLIIGLIITFGHNLTDNIQLGPANNLYKIWVVLHQPGFMSLGPDKGLMVMYPLIPWLGIMMLGYSLGMLYTKNFDPVKRKKLLFNLGLAAVVLFIVLRFINAYGDPAPWSTQKNTVYTFMSFLNATKYPVSLLFTLMTLGPVLMILSLMERIDTSRVKFLTVFGRVPLFYYILHFFILHTVALFLFMQKTGRSFNELDFHFNKSFGGITQEGGYSLAWAYVAWITLVILLYPLCRWYNRYKSTHSDWWLSYL
jgi:uncharacterized membrane protein